MVVNGDRIRVLAERDPAKLPWGELGADIVLECTGLFASKEKAGKHLAGGAKKVVISAPADGVDATIVYGVNHQTLRKDMTVISNASCTTNCLAPLVKPLHDDLGVVSGIMTTVHAYTNDQVLTDVYHSDLRRARSATMSMIPTKTGAAAAVGLVLPELKGKLDGFSVRVPTINVSFVDLTFVAKRATTAAEVNAILRKASEGALKGILELHRGTARLGRFQPQPGVRHRRRPAHEGPGRHAGEGLLLVRQRVGLLEPHARHDARLVAGV